jgi:hypothetical protein
MKHWYSVLELSIFGEKLQYLKNFEREVKEFMSCTGTSLCINSHTTDELIDYQLDLFKRRSMSLFDLNAVSLESGSHDAGFRLVSCPQRFGRIWILMDVSDVSGYVYLKNLGMLILQDGDKDTHGVSAPGNQTILPLPRNADGSISTATDDLMVKRMDLAKTRGTSGFLQFCRSMSPFHSFPFSGQVLYDPDYYFLTNGKMSCLRWVDTQMRVTADVPASGAGSKWAMGHIWRVRRADLPYWHVPTALSGQTQCVKWFYHVLAVEFNLRNDDRHKFRTYAAELEGFPPPKEGGDFSFQGRDKLISGHLVNMLLMAKYVPVDFGTVYAHYEWNLRMASHIKIDSNVKVMIRDNLLYERVQVEGVRSLWHTPLEYKLAFPVAKLIAETFGLQFISSSEYNKLQKELGRMLRAYGHLEKRVSVGLRR